MSDCGVEGDEVTGTQLSPLLDSTRVFLPVSLISPPPPLCKVASFSVCDSELFYELKGGGAANCSEIAIVSEPGS